MQRLVFAAMEVGSPQFPQFSPVLLIGAGFACGGSLRASRAWPLAWPLPPGPEGRQRLQCSRVGPRRSFLRSGQKGSPGALDAGGAAPDNARRSGPVSVTFRTAIGRSACGGRPGRFSRSRSHLGALRRGLPARGCGPADLAAAPRPEGSRPSGRGSPPPGVGELARDPARPLTCPHAASRNPLDVFASPRLNWAGAGRPGAPKACL